MQFFIRPLTVFSSMSVNLGNDKSSSSVINEMKMSYQRSCQ